MANTWEAGNNGVKAMHVVVKEAIGVAVDCISMGVVDESVYEGER
jgi:hypothetical protein